MGIAAAQLQAADERATALASMRPGPDEWSRRLSAAKQQALTPEQRRFREELGLDPSRPVIMSGHQAGIWHPGILAKWLAIAACARAWDVQAAWLIVDSDTNDCSTVRFPVRDKAGVLGVSTWSSVPGLEIAGGRIAGHVPTGRAPARSPSGLPPGIAGAATPGVADGLRQMHAALASHAAASSLAEQMALAARDLVRGSAGVEQPVALVSALGLSRTSAFGEMLGRLASDEQAAASYRRAVGAHPEAHVAADESLPLWSIGAAPMSPRKPVNDPIDAEHPERYAPRALLLTGLMRWLGCDLFIHGTGGGGTDGAGGYDTITEAWFADMGLKLAPIASVTATLRLDLGGPEMPTPEAIDRAQWLAHAARHHPGLIDDQAGQLRRDHVLDELRVLRHKRDSASKRGRLDAYRRLHEIVDRARTEHAARLAAIAERAEQASSRRDEAAIVAERTWAFPMYAPSQLSALRVEIEQAFAQAAKV